MQIHAEGLTKIFFKGQANQVIAVDNVNLTISSGEFLAVTGPSGSGKTTLLSLIGLLTRPTGGKIVFDNDEVTSYSDGWRTKFRKEHMGIIFQQYNLLPDYLAWENVALPLVCRDTAKAARRKAAIELMNNLGLDRRADFKVAHLSGGEQQRTAIARALITNPQTIIADEPTSSVDAETKKVIIDAFETLRRNGKTLIVATHDEDLLSRADRRYEVPCH